MTDLFESNVKETYTCQTCGLEYNRETTCTAFYVPLTGSTVEENMNNYLSNKEEVDSYCEHCCPEDQQRHLPAKKKVKTTHDKKSQIVKPADIVAISIKRFTNDGKKIMKRVKENLTIMLADVNYELKGTIIHSGYTIHRGHYFANLFFEAGQVVNCNDLDISKGPKMEGLGFTFLFEKSNGITTLGPIPAQFSSSNQQQNKKGLVENSFQILESKFCVLHSFY